MITKKIRILIACGAGVATSTMAMEAIKALVKKEGVNAEIVKCTLQEIQDRQNNVDVICTTTNYSQPVSKPIISVFGLISGINEEKIKNELIKIFNEILDQKN